MDHLHQYQIQVEIYNTLVEVHTTVTIKQIKQNKITTLEKTNGKEKD